jgi:predicted RNA methylase
MSQNTSHAVMAQRREPSDSDDFFPTPPWATRALCEWLLKRFDIADQSVLEPACGAGDMARPLAEFFPVVRAEDIVDRGFIGQERAANFLVRKIPYDPPSFDWVITNPPFNLAEEFVRRALEVCRVGCAMLVRLSFLEGLGRHERLFSFRPPLAVLQFVERVPMHKGKLTATGSTATAYCWIVWDKRGADHTRLEWLGRCRRDLERPGDYPIAEATL